MTLSHGGYAKAQPVTAYQAQRRGGRGKAATAVKDEDFVDKLFVANTHDTLLCFSSAGKMYWLKVYQLPQASRGSRGKPIVNLLPLQEGERINAVLPIHEFEENKFVFMVTAQGTVKKTSLEAFSRPRQAGIIAIELEQGDRLVGVDITDGHRRRSSCARAAARPSASTKNDVRPMGRTAGGVRGIRLPAGEEVISLIIVDEQGMVLTPRRTATASARRSKTSRSTAAADRASSRCRSASATAEMVGALHVNPDDEIMLISSSGTLVRTPVERNLDPGSQYPGRAPDPPGRRRSPGRPRAHPRRSRGDERRGGETARAAEVGDADESVSICLRAHSRLAMSLRIHAASVSSLSRFISMRVFNFSPGPAVLPLEVLEQARERAARLARHAACR